MRNRSERVAGREQRGAPQEKVKEVGRAFGVQHTVSDVCEKTPSISEHTYWNLRGSWQLLDEAQERQRDVSVSSFNLRTPIVPAAE